MAIDPASATLAPGFRFHPTDEELVSYYLKRKVCGKPFRFDAISDVDVYKSEPWDLPGQSRLKSRDLEWYFFSLLDRKYGNGSRTNRATERGYWKTTGKDRAVLHRSRTVGMKKTLVYHNGRAPRGERTNWVMHEYRLVDEQLENSGIFQDAFVLCRIFQKSGSGPKNGEQYGAPFVEEEWENDELVMVPGEEAVGEVTFGDDEYLDANDLEPILGVDIPEGDVPPPFSFSSGNNITNVQEPLDLVIDAQALLASMGEIYYDPEQPDDMKLLDLQVQNDMDAIPVKYEDVGESSYTVNSVGPDYLLDEPFIDVANNQFGAGLLDRHDLPNADDEDPHFDELEEYLAFFDADEFMAFDYENMMGSEDLFAEQSCLTQLDVNGGAQQETMGSQQLTQGLDNDAESSSKLELGKPGSADTQNPITNRANRVLKDIPAPPAFAAEFPTKEAALLLNSAYRSSTPAHFTAGMIQVEDMTLGGNGAYWSLGKDADVNVLLSLRLSPNDSDAAKAEPAASRCWFYLLLSWVLILTTSCKIGSYFCSSNAA